ncbi:MAG: glycosyltransferase [Ferruginibacter sp.]
MSLIISSFNQKKRLRLCLQSAIAQQIGPNVTDYQIIVADDNSTDGTLDMLRNEFNDKITVNLSPYSEDKKYTLADNWNAAVKIIPKKFERLIFTNGDILFAKGFIEAHVDPIMQDHIIIGPAMRTYPNILPFIDSEKYDYQQLIRAVGGANSLAPDMRQGLIAHTYNMKDHPWNVYGYNFSVKRDHFDQVNGFPSFKQYGDEDTKLGANIINKIGCDVRTNKNALGIHLWHPQHNSQGKVTRDEYSL